MNVPSLVCSLNLFRIKRVLPNYKKSNLLILPKLENMMSFAFILTYLGRFPNLFTSSHQIILLPSRFNSVNSLNMSLFINSNCVILLLGTYDKREKKTIKYFMHKT